MSFRGEKKFRLTISDFHKFETYLHQQGMEELYGPRIVSSIYFDTVELQMFNDSEEGVLPRKKVRVRWYNKVDKFTLETKISSIEGRFKVTENIRDFGSGEAYFVKNFTDAQYGQIQPALKVSYERSYFMLKNLRITLDKNITYQNLRTMRNRKYYDPERVIEVKIPANFSDDVFQKSIPYSTTRFSKYSRGLLLSMGDLSEI